MFGRGSLFDSDPFLRDPFSHMDNMMRSMFNDPFFGQPMMMLPPPLFPGFGFGPGAQPHPRQQLPPPVVEEVVDEEEENQQAAPAASHNDPLVEEPDDPPAASTGPRLRTGARQPHPQSQDARQQRRNAPQQQQQAFPSPQGMFPGLGGGLGGGTGGFYSYSSSSSSYSSTGGPNGLTYSTTTTSRSGPGQVRETQTTVRDGRTGQQSITISRGLGDKARTITRRRDASGQEVTEDHLEGPVDAATFDHQWAQEAEQNLPTWGPRQPALRHGRPSRTGGGGHWQQQQQQPQLALPSSGHHGAYPAPYGGYGHPGQRYG